MSSLSAQAIAAEMVAARGWGTDQFECLVNLWERESGWRVDAQNSSSGAYGIPQALPGSKMASADDWRTNPATRSSGAWATSRAGTATRAVRGRTSSTATGTDREGAAVPPAVLLARGARHGQDVERRVELLLGDPSVVDEPHLQDDLADRLAFGQRLLGDGGRVLVAQVAVQRRDDRRRRLRILAAPLHIGIDAVHAAVGEQARRVGQQADRLEQVAGDHRQHHVELEVARDPPNAMAASLPMTWAHTMHSASASTGFTLPGMIDDPGCRSGR